MEIAERVGCSEPTVIRWRSRFAEHGMAGLADEPRSGKPPTILAAVRDEILSVTLTEPPTELGITHWSSRLLAARLRRDGKPVSHATVARVWKHFGIQPHRSGTFKFSTDPELEAKVRDIVGLYLDPPAKAIVLCVDEKSQIQALDRTAPMLPLRPGLPESRTHDYVRHGTTTLFAALEVATGKVVDACYDRHRHQEFLRFLKQVAKAYPRRELHVVVDNYAAHKHPAVTAWLARHPRITLHFTPTSGSWLNLVEVFFGDPHPPSHPPRHLHLRRRPRIRDRDLHRRLERPLPTLHLDQGRRHHPRQSHPTEEPQHTHHVRDTPLAKRSDVHHCQASFERLALLHASGHLTL